MHYKIANCLNELNTMFLFLACRAAAFCSQKTSSDFFLCRSTHYIPVLASVVSELQTNCTQQQMFFMLSLHFLNSDWPAKPRGLWTNLPVSRAAFQAHTAARSPIKFQAEFPPLSNQREGF